MEPCIGSRFEELTTIDSTNLYAMQKIHAGLASQGDVFFAREQVAGRGQRGKKWWSVAGQNISMSVVFETAKLASSERFRLSAMAALSVIDWLQAIAPGNWKTKWPNDIYYGDRKAGGILIENLAKGGRWSHSVVGIGINLNQNSFPDHLPNPVSLHMVTQKTYQSALEARRLCSFLEVRWQQLKQGGWLAMLRDYNENLFGRGEICRIKKESAVIPCVIQGVNDQGQLTAGENSEWIFEFGEVNWVL